MPHLGGLVNTPNGCCHDGEAHRLHVEHTRRSTGTVRVSVRVEVEVDSIWADRLDLLSRDAVSAVSPYGKVEHATVVTRRSNA